MISKLPPNLGPALTSSIAILLSLYAATAVISRLYTDLLYLLAGVAVVLMASVVASLIAAFTIKKQLFAVIASPLIGLALWAGLSLLL